MAYEQSRLYCYVGDFAALSRARRKLLFLDPSRDATARMVASRFVPKRQCEPGTG